MLDPRPTGVVMQASPIGHMEARLGMSHISSCTV